MVDPEGLVSAWNQRAAAIFGYPAQEVLGKHFSLFFSPEDRTSGRPQGLLKAALGRGWAVDDAWRVSRNGERFEVHAMVTVLYGPSGSLLGFAILVHNLTARRATHASHTHQTSLLQLTHDALLIRDLHGRITFWNDGARELYQWTETEALGQVGHELLQTIFPVPLKEIEAKVRGNATWDGRLVHRRKDGALLTVKSRWSLQRDESGAPIAFLELNRDNTRQKQLEMELEQNHAQTAANARLASLGMMAGGIAHEINNPLGIIQASASNLAEILDAGHAPLAELRKHSTRIIETAERIAKTVSSLKFISRRQSSDPLLSAPVFKIIEESLELCRENFRMRSITLTSPPVDPTLTVQCREGQIAQILLNLLQNALYAVEALPGPRKVFLEVARTMPWLAISVLDNGAGFTDDAKQFATDAFFTTKPVGQGTGLGLSISSSIAESHGGKIKFSERDGLTCVSLLLPCSV